MHWSRSLTNDYLVVQVVLALEDMGAFESLRRHGAITSDLAKELDVKEELLSACLEFLYVTTDFIRKNEAIYSLADQDFPKPLFILRAYKDVFDNLAEIAKGEKKYGYEIMRDGWYLQKASEIVTKKAIGDIVDLLIQEQETQLVDLGCGSAESVIAFCKTDKIRSAIGIDMNENIVFAAKKRIKEEGLSSQVTIINSNIVDFDKWSKYIASNKKTVFLASTVFHELLVNGEKWLITFLRKFSLRFPNNPLYILEFDTPTFDDLKREENIDKKFFFAMYKLWHPFTNQGMPQPQEVWEKIIKKSGWKIKSVSRANMNLLIYHCEQ